MGKGSSKTKNEKNQNRNFYTFTLNNADPRDKELIEFLADRSTTASVKDGLRLLIKSTNKTNNQTGNSQDLIQILSLLGTALNGNASQNNLTNLISQLNQNISQTNNEQSASLNIQESKQELTEKDKEKIQKGKNKASAALSKYKF